MATLYVSYFGSTKDGAVGSIIGSETITTSGTSAAGGAIPLHAAFAQVYATVAHYVTVGTGTPTAAAGNSFVQGANLAPIIRIENGLGQGAKKIAAITA